MFSKKPLALTYLFVFLTCAAFFVMGSNLLLSMGQDTDNGTVAAGDTNEDVAKKAAKEASKENIFQLLLRGGWVMIPIAALSLVTATFTIERFFGLRRNQVMPDELIYEIDTIASQEGGIEPREAYKACQRHPSTLATVLKTTFLKVGRPHSEIEQALTDVTDREAERLYANVRWLMLAAAVAPLMGLFGTVWGMIDTFQATAAQASVPGGNKVETLAQGIYVALVTTFSGLSVAIPSAIFAFVFEGRIQRLFREMDELLLGIMPQLERYEGRMRMTSEPLPESVPTAAEVAEPPTSPPKSEPPKKAEQPKK